jgi:hypothetical protein
MNETKMQESPKEPPPSNEELESAMFQIVGYVAVQKFIKEKSEPIQEENKLKQKKWEREVRKANDQRAIDLAEGLDDPEWLLPEEPEYKKTATYLDMYEQLPRATQVKVLARVAQERAAKRIVVTA